MNKFIMLNWYHFDLNNIIINKLKSRKKLKIPNKIKIKSRMDNDFRLKIKQD